jgi:hypothetical protein
MYALAEGAPTYKLTYVSAEDFQILSFEFSTEDIQPDVDRIIDGVYGQIASAQLPAFEPREDWHAKPEYGTKYSSYPEWVHLKPDLALEKLKRQFPDAHKKLMKGLK